MMVARYLIALTVLGLAPLLLWSPVHGHPFLPAYGPVLVTNGNDIYLLQTTDAMGAGQTDVLLAHFNIEGTASWARSWGTPVEETGNAVACDSSGNGIVAGQYAMSIPTDLGGYVPTPSFIVKFDPGGSLLWATNVGWSDHTVDLKGVATDAGGNIYVTGSTWKWGPEMPTGGYEPTALFYTAKFASNGDALWAKRWNSKFDEQHLGATCVAVHGLDVAVAGIQLNPTSGKSEVVVLTYDAGSGDLLSSEAWGIGYDDVTAVAAGFHDDGSLYVCCGSSGSVSDIFLLKYASGGGLRMAQGWGNMQNQDPRALGIQGDDVFIAGSTATGSGSGKDGFSLWFRGDVLTEQSRYHDILNHADTGFLGVVPLDATTQLHFGTGPFDMARDYLKEQLNADNWFPSGTVRHPATYDDGSCAFTAMGEPQGMQVGGMLSYEQLAGFLYDQYRFLGYLRIKPKAQVPQAVLTADASQGQAPLPVAFDAAGSWCDNGTIATYSWDFDLADGADYTDAQGPGATETHTYLQPGTYQASVRVTSSDGSTSAAFWVVFVD